MYRRIIGKTNCNKKCLVAQTTFPLGTITNFCLYILSEFYVVFLKNPADKEERNVIYLNNIID